MTTTAHAAPARVVHWTRLGAGMGYTNTEPKRQAIRAALDAMVWLDPVEVADVLDSRPVRFHVRGLLFGRLWALSAAATVPLPEGVAPDPFKTGRLIGLAAVTGERWVLLDLGYEALDLYHERPAVEAVGR